VLSEIGYVQGMNDILAIIVPVMDNEADAFWCFVGQMKMMKDLFSQNQPDVQLCLSKLVEKIEVRPFLVLLLKNLARGSLSLQISSVY
jgi:hypothetical protein